MWPAVQAFDSIIKTNKRSQRKKNRVNLALNSKSETLSVSHQVAKFTEARLFKNCFLITHLIITIAFAHPNFSPSLVITTDTLSEASSPLSPNYHDPPATTIPPTHHNGQQCFLPSVPAGGLPAGQSAVWGPDGWPAWHLPLHRGWRARVRLPWVPQRGLGLRELLCAGWVIGFQLTYKVPYRQDVWKVLIICTSSAVSTPTPNWKWERTGSGMCLSKKSKSFFFALNVKRHSLIILCKWKSWDETLLIDSEWGQSSGTK